MLIYTSGGIRDFCRHPVPPHRTRPAWEFYAVLKGRIAPLPLEKPLGRSLRAHTLWVFPPEHPHGWTGDPRRKAQVAVFHFSKVPAALSARVDPVHGLARPLSTADLTRLRRISRDLRPHYWQPDEFSALHAEHALLGLTLIALGASARSDGPGESASHYSALARVETAEAWIRANLCHHPTITDLSCQLSTSVGHLRRLFLAVRGTTPQIALTRVRLERAEHLLAHSDLKLGAIAAECGFTGASAFCQVFKRHHHTTPDAWRHAHRKNPRKSAS